MTNRREPGSVPFWLAVGALLFIVVPYGFMGASQPRWCLLPIWFHLSLAASLTIAALSAWRIWRSWRLEDDDD